MISSQIIGIILIVMLIPLSFVVGMSEGHIAGKREVCKAWNITEKPNQAHQCIVQYDDEDNEDAKFIEGFVYSTKCGMELEYVENWLEEQKNE